MRPLRVKISTLDRHFSFLVRERDGWTCKRCKHSHKRGSQGLHASHYFGRARGSVRWSFSNVDSLCLACHRIWGSDDREAYRMFKIKQLGLDGFHYLELAANRTEKRDPLMVRLWLREEFKVRGLNWDLSKNK